MSVILAFIYNQNNVISMLYIFRVSLKHVKFQVTNLTWKKQERSLELLNGDCEARDMKPETQILAKFSEQRRY